MEGERLGTRHPAAAAARSCAAKAALFAVLVLASACTPASSPPSNGPADVAIEHLSSAGAEAWLEQNGAALARDLSPEEAERVARAALQHPSPAVRVFGIGLLFERVDERTGAEAAATRALQGDDLTGLFWGWMHARPGAVTDRRLELIRKDVQSRLPNLAGEERARAEALLCASQSGC